MAIVCDLDHIKHIFSHPTTNTCHNNVRPDFNHHPGCVIDGHNQFEHGEVGITWPISPLFATTHILRFLFLLLLYLNKYGMQSITFGM